MQAHEASTHYKEFFDKVMSEELMAGPPVITKGKTWHGFRR
jgi:quinol monooxygenase YgiN